MKIYTNNTDRKLPYLYRPGTPFERPGAVSVGNYIVGIASPSAVEGFTHILDSPNGYVEFMIKTEDFNAMDAEEI